MIPSIVTQDGNPEKRRLPGAHLLAEPEETLARMVPHMPAMGITRIANVTGLDRIGIPVVMVCRPNSRSVAVSQGKGCTLPAAKASGLMESIESWHAERIALPLKLGSAADLADSHRLVDTDRLPALRDSRYEHTLPILWIEGIDLMDGRGTWLPFEMVHTRYAHPAPPGGGCFHQSSNGLASGNHKLEALSHAICEVIERDSTSLWHCRSQAGRNATRLQLDSITDATGRDLIDRIQAAGLSLTVWNTTSDIGLPCFECVILDEAGTVTHPGLGAGCHPSKSVALVRAIVEAVQVRTTYIAGSRDDLSHEEYDRAAVRQRIAAFRDMSGRGSGTVRFADIADVEFPRFAEDLDWILARLRSIGIDEVVCVDLSKPELAIPVVRVVIPGLEGPHDDEGYVPGPRARAIARARP